MKGLDLKFRKLLRSLISIGHDDRNACVFDERCFGGWLSRICVCDLYMRERIDLYHTGGLFVLDVIPLR